MTLAGIKGGPKTFTKYMKTEFASQHLVEIFQSGKVACEKAGKYENARIPLAS